MEMEKYKDNLARAMLRPINPAAIVILGLYTVMWGLWVASPFWSVFASAQIFSLMGAFPPVGAEIFWGLLAVLVGVMTTYGAVKRSYKPLVRGAAIAGWLWTMISILYFIGDWTNTGGITAAAFAIYSAFIWLNLRVNNKFTDHEEDLFIE